MKVQINNIKVNIEIFLLILLIFSCKNKEAEIIHNYSINKKIINNYLNLNITKQLKNKKNIKKKFEINNGKLFEVIDFYDFNGSLTKKFKLNLSEIDSESKVNVADSINNNFAGLPELFKFKYYKFESNNGNILIIKKGYDENILFEKYEFTKDFSLVDVYF